MNNVPPLVNGRNSVFVVNASSTRLVATFTDPGTSDATSTVTIAWGDGTADSILSDVSVGVTGTHTYLSSDVPGPYPEEVIASVTVTDKDGGSTTIEVLHTIVDLVIPSVNAGATSQLLREAL